MNYLIDVVSEIMKRCPNLELISGAYTQDSAKAVFKELLSGKVVLITVEPEVNHE